MQCLWCNVNWIWVFSSSFLLRALCGADHSKCKNIVHRTECNDEQRLWMRLSKVRHNYSWNNNIMFCICSFSNGLPLTFREAYSCLANNMRIKDDASLLLAMPFSKWSIDLWLNVSEQLNFLKRSTHRFFSSLNEWFKWILTFLFASNNNCCMQVLNTEYVITLPFSVCSRFKSK